MLVVNAGLYKDFEKPPVLWYHPGYLIYYHHVGARVAIELRIIHLFSVAGRNHEAAWCRSSGGVGEYILSWLHFGREAFRPFISQVLLLMREKDGVTSVMLETGGSEYMFEPRCWCWCLGSLVGEEGRMSTNF